MFVLPPTPTVADVLSELDQLVSDALDSPQVAQDWAALRATHHLADTPEARRDYVVVKLALHATREGGFWGTDWTITDQPPQSDRMWADWLGGARRTEAECDEISAATAVVARGLGVAEVGLFWPTWNHTVAVWRPLQTNGKRARVVLPTSQVFLDDLAGLGTQAFDPRTQPVIYDYTRRDVAGTTRVPLAVARWMSRPAIGVWLKASEDTLNRLRRARDAHWTDAQVRAWAASASLSATDRAAVEAYLADQ